MKLSEPFLAFRTTFGRKFVQTLLEIVGFSTHMLFNCTSGKSARAFVEGEYHSAKDICAAAAGLAPEPLGWGTYHGASGTVYFILSEFRDMDFDQEPEPAQFASQLARVHQTTSQNGRFGYHVPTVVGAMERSVSWDESWARLFATQLKGIIEQDNRAMISTAHLYNTIGLVTKAFPPGVS
ncbi:MFS general substrate transporter [Apiospora hydei]|uniref:MFS general substrate transporter n=1 Tax=Apiospora hydei TaxID=1337664 RepID=A0ABR1V5K2_9PEZI